MALTALQVGVCSVGMAASRFIDDVDVRLVVCGVNDSCPELRNAELQRANLGSSRAIRGCIEQCSPAVVDERHARALKRGAAVRVIDEPVASKLKPERLFTVRCERDIGTVDPPNDRSVGVDPYETGAARWDGSCWRRF